MISDEVLEFLKTAFTEYNKLVGKDYLIACYVNKNFPLEFYVFRIKKENFWHLLGCECNEITAEELYNIHMNGDDNIQEYLTYTANIHACREKYTVFMRLFNFIDKAKEIRISKTDGSPEQYAFKMAVGNYSGIIGYDSKNSDILFPKSVRLKTIDSINANSMRIAFILSKAIDESSFDNADYCVSKKLFTKMLAELPDRFNSSFKKKEQMNDNS